MVVQKKYQQQVTETGHSVIPSKFNNMKTNKKEMRLDKKGPLQKDLPKINIVLLLVEYLGLI